MVLSSFVEMSKPGGGCVIILDERPIAGWLQRDALPSTKSTSESRIEMAKLPNKSPSERGTAHGDQVDHILGQWKEERPDLDFSAMAVIARISRASRLLERKIEAILGDYGLNEPGFGVLAALRRAGPPYRLSPTSLYNSLLITSGAMTNRIDRLEDAGFVERLPDPADRRSMLVALTPEGRRVIDEALTAHTANESNLLASFSKKQLELLANLLRDLLVELDDGESPQEAPEEAAV